MMKFTEKELAPNEDQSFMIVYGYASPNAGPQQMRRYAKQIYNIVASHPEHDQVFQFTGINGLNTTLPGVILKPCDQRSKDASTPQTDLQRPVNHVAGAKVYASLPPPPPTRTGANNPPREVWLGTKE